MADPKLSRRWRWYVKFTRLYCHSPSACENKIWLLMYTHEMHFMETLKYILKMSHVSCYEKAMKDLHMKKICVLESYVFSILWVFQRSSIVDVITCRCDYMWMCLKVLNKFLELMHFTREPQLFGQSTPRGDCLL